MVSFCLFVFPLIGKAEWGHNPIYCWLGLYFWYFCLFVLFYFYFTLQYCVCLLFRWGVLHRVLLVVGWCRSFIHVVSFVWVLTIWYTLGLVLCWSRVLESVLPLQRLRAWFPDGSCPDPGGYPHCQFWVPCKRVAGADSSWILQPDPLVLPLDFGAPT